MTDPKIVQVAAPEVALVAARRADEAEVTRVGGGPGAPRERSPRAAPCPSSAEAPQRLLTRDQLALYWPVAARALALVCGLSCVAWLGDRARDQERDGAPLELAAQAAELAEAGLEPAATGTQAGRTPGAGAPSERPTQAPPCVPAEAPRPKAMTPDGRVILNEAGPEELMTLTGIGQRRAEAILELRARLGKFRKVSDLLRIRGIGPRTLEKLRERLVVDRPADAPAAGPDPSAAAPAAALGPPGAPQGARAPGGLPGPG
jgi:competence protein ComEA